MNIGTQSQFDTMTFPLIKSVIPSILGTDREKLKEIESEVKSINRDNKIKSIEDDVKYEEMKIQDHPDYEEAVSSLPKVQPLPSPSGNIFYMDYQYGSVESESHQIISSDPNESNL
jgi:hypothetical protein